MRASPFNLSDQAEVKATVAAINEVGESDVSSVGEGALIPEKTVPGPPTNLTVDKEETTTSQIKFTWNAPVDDGGSPIINYCICWGQTDCQYSDDGVHETTYILTGLLENTDYVFEVQARNLIYGDSEYT